MTSTIKELLFGKGEQEGSKKEEEDDKSSMQKGEGPRRLFWKHDCFLAHTWGTANATHKQVLFIAEHLREAGMEVWVDEVNLRTFVSDEIVKGLRQSAAVLVFINGAYLRRIHNPESNAAKELKQSALKGAHRLIPVVLEEEYLDNSKWFGSSGAYYILDALYFNMSSEAAIIENVPDLVDRIKDIKMLERYQTGYDDMNEERYMTQEDIEAQKKDFQQRLARREQQKRTD